MEDKLDKLIREVQELKESIEELKGIECEGTVLETEERLENEDAVEITSTTKYAYGKPIETTMKYKYKEETSPEREITSERNIYSCGIDGGNKYYQVTSYYDNHGNLIVERIQCLHDKQ